jgi:hypothetical protein
MRSGTLSGVTGDGLWLVELDSAGAVVSAKAVNGSGIEPHLFARLSNGDFVVTGRGAAYAFMAVTFDANGVQLGLHSWPTSGGTPYDEVLAAGPTGGQFALVSGNCQLLVYDRTVAAQPGVNLCGSVPVVSRLVWASNGDLVAMTQYGAVTRFTSGGMFKWTDNTGVTGSTSGLVLATDSVGRTFAGMQQNASGRFQLRQLTSTGTIGFATGAFPSQFVSFAGRIDGNGNVYLGGSSDNGMGGIVPAYGFSDVVLVKNPQLLFP